MQACGSGGTAAGLALGLHLSGLPWKVHAMGVCDDPDYFYSYIDGLLKGMGVDHTSLGTTCRFVMKAWACQHKICQYGMVKHAGPQTNMTVQFTFMAIACYSHVHDHASPGAPSMRLLTSAACN